VFKALPQQPHVIVPTTSECFFIVIDFSGYKLQLYKSQNFLKTLLDQAFLTYH